MTTTVTLPAEINEAVETAQRPFREIAAHHGNMVIWKEESEFAHQAFQRTQLLGKCTPQSVTNAIVNIAAIGLSLNPSRQHCALVPRYNNRKRTYECHADPMYRGLLKLATDGGKVLRVDCQIVYQDEIDNGDFKIRMGSEPSIMHTPSVIIPRDGIEDAVGAYCIAEIDGARFPKIDFMRADEILKVMESSDMIKYARRENKPITGPWADWPEEMWKKTVMKRAAKMWPQGNDRLDQAIRVANIAEGYIEPKEDDIEGTAEVVIKTISSEQAKELRTLCRSSKTRVEKVYETYAIKKMEDLPIEKFGEARDRLQTRSLLIALKDATKEDEFYASDYGMTLSQLEGHAAEVQSKGRLFSKR